MSVEMKLRTVIATAEAVSDAYAGNRSQMARAFALLTLREAVEAWRGAGGQLEAPSPWHLVAQDPPPVGRWLLVWNAAFGEVIEARRDGPGWCYRDGTGAPLEDESHWREKPGAPVVAAEGAK